LEARESLSYPEVVPWAINSRPCNVFWWNEWSIDAMWWILFNWIGGVEGGGE